MPVTENNTTRIERLEKALHGEGDGTGALPRINQIETREKNYITFRQLMRWLGAGIGIGIAIMGIVIPVLRERLGG